jgi:hypothetical protein
VERTLSSADGSFTESSFSSFPSVNVSPALAGHPPVPFLTEDNQGNEVGAYLSSADAPIRVHLPATPKRAKAGVHSSLNGCGLLPSKKSGSPQRVRPVADKMPARRVRLATGRVRPTGGLEA